MRSFFSFDDDFFTTDNLDSIWDTMTTAIPELRFYEDKNLTLRESLQTTKELISSSSTLDDVINLAMRMVSSYNYLPSVRENFEWMNELGFNEHLRYHLALIFFYEAAVSSQKHNLRESLTKAGLDKRLSNTIASRIAKRKEHFRSTRVEDQKVIISHFVERNASPIDTIFNEWLNSVTLFPSSNSRFSYDRVISSKIDGFNPIWEKATDNYRLFIEYELERFNSHNYLAHILSLYSPETTNNSDQTYWGDYTHILMLYPLLGLRKIIVSECCHANTHEHQYLDYMLQYQIFFYFPIIITLFRFFVRIMRESNNAIMTSPIVLSEYIPDNFSQLELNAIPTEYINEHSKKLFKDTTNLFYNLHYSIGINSDNNYFLNILFPELRKLAVQKNIEPCRHKFLDNSIVRILDNKFSDLSNYRIPSRSDIYNTDDNILRMYNELHHQ